jgi:hypothetical protein
VARIKLERTRKAKILGIFILAEANFIVKFFSIHLITLQDALSLNLQRLFISDANDKILVKVNKV